MARAESAWGRHIGGAGALLLLTAVPASAESALSLCLGDAAPWPPMPESRCMELL